MISAIVGIRLVVDSLAGMTAKITTHSFQTYTFRGQIHVQNNKKIIITKTSDSHNSIPANKTSLTFSSFGLFAAGTLNLFAKKKLYKHKHILTHTNQATNLQEDCSISISHLQLMKKKRESLYSKTPNLHQKTFRFDARNFFSVHFLTLCASANVRSFAVFLQFLLRSFVFSDE